MNEVWPAPFLLLYVQWFLMNCFCHLRSVSGFIKVKCFNARSDKDLITANVILSFLENISFLFCKFRCRSRISFSFFTRSIEKIKSLRFEKRLEKNDCSKLTMKLNMDLSYCNNMRFERTRMNYATPRPIIDYPVSFQVLDIWQFSIQAFYPAFSLDTSIYSL